MARSAAPILAFNRGEISPLSLARVDIDRVNLSAELMKNWLPKTQGAMSIRPGWGYKGSTLNDTGAALIDFIASTDETNILEMTKNKMRIWSDGVPISRVPVTTTITDFNADTGLWRSSGVNGGVMGLGDTGLVLDAINRGGVAKASAKIPLGDTGQLNVEHSLAINVARGPVKLRVGTDTGRDDIISEATLRTGYHNLAFTPDDTGGVHIQFLNSETVDRIVSSIAIGDTGTIEITTPWDTDDLPNLRWTQSADVCFVACSGRQQYRIERRAIGRSWSVVKYTSDNGPFLPKTADVRLKAGNFYGNTTLTSDQPFFTPEHVGALFYLWTPTYEWEFRLAGEDVWTDPIRVSGIEDAGTVHERDWFFKISGTFVATLNIQTTTGDPVDGPYTATPPRGVSAVNITDTGTFEKNDDSENEILNNVVMWARLGIIPGGYTSGAAIIKLTQDESAGPGYAGGGDYSIFRVTGYTSPTVVQVEVLKTPTTLKYTTNWREGAWSDAQRWPTDVSLFEGRLWWHGQTYTWGSASDDYEDYDDQQEGDAAPIIRVLGEGPVDSIVFSVGLQRLLLGTVGGVLSLRSTSFDEPLTRQNMTAKFCTTQGAKAIPAVRTEGQAIYIQRSGSRCYALLYDVDANDYKSKELTLLNPDILKAGVVALRIQKQPDTRVHCILSNGEVAILTYEPDEELLCWSRVSTDGFVEDVVILPGTDEDQVYYLVKRVINGNDKRYIEQWAMESETVGGTVNKLADSFITRSVSDGDTGSTLTGLSHLEGETVSLWRDGRYRGDFTVTGGAITDTGSSGGDTGVIGLKYEADYRSAKLAYAADAGPALTTPKRVDRVGLILYNTHHKGLQFGGDSGHLDYLPDMIDKGQKADTGKIFETFDQQSFTLDGVWDTDSRLFLRAESPKPATVVGAVVAMKTEENL